MISEYQFFHGALLHELIRAAGQEIRIAPVDLGARSAAYLINGDVGLLLKHSASRLSPWQFTFPKESIDELRSLGSMARICFAGFVCGSDGFVCIRDNDLLSILRPTAKDVASLRIERRPRRMYWLSSAGNRFERKVPRGADDLIAGIRQQNTECALPSSETAVLGSASSLADNV